MTEECCGKMAYFRQNSNPYTLLKNKKKYPASGGFDLGTFRMQKEYATTAPSLLQEGNRHYIMEYFTSILLYLGLLCNLHQRVSKRKMQFFKNLVAEF